MGAVIDVVDLTKSYGDTRAVDKVTLSVEQGEFFGILGPNGAGKTTFLEIVGGLRPADSGSVSLLGLSPWPRNDRLLSRVGVQLQASAFFERLTAREQLRAFASLYGMPHSRADDLLDQFGLTDKASTRTEKLSGGQMQRLSIACSLVHEPAIVFLDEPTAALDPQARRNLWDLLSSLNTSGRTVVLTTHYMDEAELLCDRVAVMDHGDILTVGPPATLVRGMDAPTRISVEREALTPDVARSLAGVESIEQADASLTLTTRDPVGVLTELARRQALHGLQVRGATLEDVFLSLTGREYRA